MLRQADRWEIELTDEQIWAIWGHDYVYQPGADDNEKRSAALMVDLIQQHSDGHTFIDHGLIRQIIRDTKGTTPPRTSSRKPSSISIF